MSTSNPWQTITPEELSRHTDLDSGDAWISVKGIVYDVSSYAQHHPGGESKIRKYLGTDCTETFNAIHSYVDPCSVLNGYQIGLLKGHPLAPSSFLPKLRSKNWCCLFGSRYKPPTTYFKQDSIVGTHVLEFTHPSHEHDWTVGITQKKYLHIYKCLGVKKAWLVVYELPTQLETDLLKINFRNNYRHIEITLRKPLPTSVWLEQTNGLKSLGRLVTITEPQSLFDAFIIYKKCLTPNVLMFGVQIVNSARIGVPLGFHVQLMCNGVARPYTPVCFDLMDHSGGHAHQSVKQKEKKQREDLPLTTLYFMIKIYPHAGLTQMLDAIELDDGRELVTLQVSTPHGHFDPEFLQEFAALLLIAAGTGLTPMIRILQRFWELNEHLRGKRILLWHFVQKEPDLIWKKQILKLEEVAAWFHYFPVLTQCDDRLCQWKGLRGRISEEMMKKCLDEITLEKRGVKKACICGPPGFNGGAVQAVKELVPMQNIFVFSS